MRYINGKWLAQQQSGTQRYATQTVRSAIEAGFAADVTLIVPADAEVPSWADGLPIVRSRTRGFLFEQLALPWSSRNGHLYSLAGPAPVVKRNQTVVMHDATPFRFSTTFRRAFVIWYHLMYWVLVRRAVRICTVSHFSQCELADVLKVSADRFEIAPCGSDHVDTDAVARPSSVPVDMGSFALIVGNLAPHKNTMQAANALAEAGIRVIVVGARVDNIFRSVRTAASDAIAFTGRVSDSELNYLYTTALVHVAPSGYEGFGIPIVEAGRFGCPSVWSSGSAMGEVGGRGGIEFERGDFAECALAVEKIMSDGQLRARLSSEARANAARFSWAETASVVFDGAQKVGPAHAA
ncbi:MAG: glycosyltransferase family 4 protein [Nocardiaceae bacterium]|nr:glycosyltransferase family 4 protein [Nocardiaceae bacterium]